MYDTSKSKAIFCVKMIVLALVLTICSECRRLLNRFQHSLKTIVNFALITHGVVECLKKLIFKIRRRAIPFVIE